MTATDWSGLKSEPRVAPTEDAGYDLLIAAAEERDYQQDLSRGRIAIFVLSRND